MKKVLLFAAAALASATSFAQVSKSSDVSSPLDKIVPIYGAMTQDAANKTTAQIDTGYLTLGTFVPKGFANNYMRQIIDSSTTALVDRANPIDSGFYFGTNVFNNRGYAEKFYYDYGADTTFRVIGALTVFTGKVRSTSTRQVTVAMWSTAAKSALGPKSFNSGLPGTMKASKTFPAVNIGADSVKIVLFDNNGYQLVKATDTSFFIGYTTPAYTWSNIAGYTFGLRSSRAGFGFNVGGFFNTANDTFFNNQNAYMKSNGTWSDVSLDYGLVRNLSILPYVVRTTPTSVDKALVSNRGLTLFGNYPNPANGNTNVKFAVKKSTSGSITVMDLAGRTLRSVDLRDLKAGENIVEVNTSDLASGTYIYMLRTDDGAGMASQMTVAH